MNLIDAANTVDLIFPTLVIGDVQVKQDNGNFVDIDTLPIPEGEQLTVTLSAAEMNTTVLTVRFLDQTVPADWLEMVVTIPTIG